MPWLETDPMDQRWRFLEDVRLARMSMTELCAHYQISRKSGYKWIDRAAEQGRRGLADRSRAPHHCPHKIADEMATLLCEFRSKHDDWGARKLLTVLQRRYPRRHDWPAPSTVADLLQREGLVRRHRRRRARVAHPGAARMPTERRTIAGRRTSLWRTIPVRTTHVASWRIRSVEHHFTRVPGGHGLAGHKA